MKVKQLKEILNGFNDELEIVIDGYNDIIVYVESEKDKDENDKFVLVVLSGIDEDNE